MKKNPLRDKTINDEKIYKIVQNFDNLIKIIIILFNNYLYK